MKGNTISNKAKLPAIHHKLDNIMTGADYDLQQLEDLKQWPNKNIEADQMEALKWICQDKALPTYSFDAVTGRVEHKFSDAYYWPVHKAVRFKNRLGTTPVRISVKNPEAVFKDVITSGLAAKKLVPKFKLAGIELKASHVMNAVSYNLVATEFFKSGVTPFIVIDGDMFLVLPTHKVKAVAIIKKVFKKFNIGTPVLEVEE